MVSQICHELRRAEIVVSGHMRRDPLHSGLGVEQLLANAIAFSR